MSDAEPEHSIARRIYKAVKNRSLLCKSRLYNMKGE